MTDLEWLFNAGVLLFLAKGLGISLLLAVISGGIAFILGTVLALSRLSSHPLIHFPALIYIELLRSLPLLLIVFFVFFSLSPLLKLGLEPFAAAVVALSAFFSAVIAEIIRAGLQSIDQGLVQAARSQGFNAWEIFRLIRMPIALRRMTPALVSQFITLVKSTSLVVVIGVQEFLSSAVIVASNPPFRAIPVYVLIAICYFVVNYSLSLFSKLLERGEIGGLKVAT